MAGHRQLTFAWGLLIYFAVSPATLKPIVDPGLFVIQGVSSCINGTGYCMLGNNCSIDVDFLPDTNGGHCDGLMDAFSPKADFVCCKYNPKGKLTSEPPTTTISSYTITDVFSVIDEHVADQENENEIPEDINPENLIDIIGVVTDFTDIVGLVTRPWTGTIPTKEKTPGTTPMTPSTPLTTPAPASPATPANIDQSTGEVTTEEPSTNTLIENTESYNELPTDINESSEEDQQSQETNSPEENTTFFAISTTPATTTTTSTSTTTTSEAASVENTESYLPEKEEEVANVSVMIVNASTSTDAPTQVVVIAASSPDPFDTNAIIFPDNPIVSDLPILETEALESETESIVNDVLGETVEANIVQGPDAISEGQDTHSESPQEVIDPSQETWQQDLPQTEQEYINISPQKPGSPDYEDYYSEYPDQLLLHPVNQNICGFRGFKNFINDVSSSRILGGVVASTVEWCWVGAIMERRSSGEKYVCSGALVESDLLVTTATCLKRLESRDLSNYIVVLGDSNLREDLPYGIQFHRLEEVITHPDYLTSGGAHASDIGVVRLRDHATLSDNVCLVCMAQQDAIFPSQSCTVTGYGIGDVPRNMLRDVRNAVPSDGILRQMSVPLFQQPKCEAALRNMTGSEILATSDSFLCAGGLDGNNACYSTLDGGSPLACEAGGRWFLAGIVSWTRDCENQDVPNVYTRVSSFSNWLQATHLRMMGFLTHQVFSQQVRWIQENVDKINKEFS